MNWYAITFRAKYNQSISLKHMNSLQIIAKLMGTNIGCRHIINKCDQKLTHLLILIVEYVH